ncbi:hypothetical protein ACN47E_003953 [Coniothyrium glycines]
MSTPTTPTVPVPSTSDLYDTDTDDEGDVTNSALPGQPVATSVPAQIESSPASPIAQPSVAPVPAPDVTDVTGVVDVPTPTSVPGTTGLPEQGSPGAASSLFRSGSASATVLADTLPSGSRNNTSTTNESQGLSTGAAAGVGVGVALAVILLALGGWLFMRRRKRRNLRERAATNPFKLHGSGADEEVARKTEIYAHHAGGPLGVGEAKEMGVDNRRRSELASPVVPVEAVGDRTFAAELQGSDVPARGGKGEERLFSDAPIEESDVPDVRDPTFMDKKG